MLTMFFCEAVKPSGNLAAKLSRLKTPAELKVEVCREGGTYERNHLYDTFCEFLIETLAGRTRSEVK